MTINELLTALRQLGIRLLPAGDKLRLEASAGALTPEVMKAVAEHKTELLAWLREWNPDRAQVLFEQAADRARRLVPVADYQWAQAARPGLLAAIDRAEAAVNEAWQRRDVTAMCAACREYAAAWQAVADAAAVGRPLTAIEAMSMF